MYIQVIHRFGVVYHGISHVSLIFSGGRWFEPGHCRRVVSLDKKLYSTLSLFKQVYKWISTGDHNAGGGGNLAMD